MRTETKSSWWRQLGSISQGMLFLDGHVTHPDALSGQHHAVHGARCAHRTDLHRRALQVLQARRLRQATALSLFR
ncbi:hypothetical protein [Pseudoxanthomonas indica]|uniref:Prepilin-type processing-associated H-X9-DG domain-containing protein n=1 Tax=Pseudoxanthomonas indica TaxID=428993 RepID=A0A1T5KLE1_9GAMM|nr:hypothetical protein [Pseudoxanthomonas indica]GGD50071.1 hypothetical protein GCM10007235_22600 [Pseudoxanthomonas indica]SKC64572.1 prepilin-type processing-associated H-X9-DG domain-containing protein [Pseudoxanthomonas indica]